MIRNKTICPADLSFECICQMYYGTKVRCRSVLFVTSIRIKLTCITVGVPLVVLDFVAEKNIDATSSFA